MIINTRNASIKTRLAKILLGVAVTSAPIEKGCLVMGRIFYNQNDHVMLLSKNFELIAVNFKFLISSL